MIGLPLLQSLLSDILVVGTGRYGRAHGPHPAKGHVDLALLLALLLSFLLALLLLPTPLAAPLVLLLVAATGPAGTESTAHPLRFVVVIVHGIVLPRHGPSFGHAAIARGRGGVVAILHPRHAEEARRLVRRRRRMRRKGSESRVTGWGLRYHQARDGGVTDG